MVTGRVHRMTELFGRLAPGATLEQARAELRAVHGAMVKEHPEAYSPKADFRIDAVRLRDQITSRARTVLLVLLAASVLVFVIACSNVANLILARTVRREGELAIRAALGASTGALRRTLLAESLLLCGAGAALGVLSARPMVAILARYASRFSVRALDLTVDSSMLWVGAALAMVAAVLLAFVPRLPSADASQWIRSGERQRADHRQHQPPAADLRRHADRRVVRAAGRRQHAAQDAALAAGGADRLRHPPRARHQRAGDVLRQNARAGRRFLPGSDPAHRRAARRGSASPSALWFPGAMPAVSAPGSQFSADGHVTRAGRRGSARAVPHRLARIFRRARRPHHRRPRFQRCRLAKDSETGGHRQPEPGAAHVPQSGCGQPPCHVDRSGDEVHRRQRRAAPHRRRRRRCRRRERGARARR